MLDAGYSRIDRSLGKSCKSTSRRIYPTVARSKRPIGTGTHDASLFDGSTAREESVDLQRAALSHLTSGRRVRLRSTHRIAIGIESAAIRARAARAESVSMDKQKSETRETREEKICRSRSVEQDSRNIDNLSLIGLHSSRRWRSQSGNFRRKLLLEYKEYRPGASKTEDESDVALHSREIFHRLTVVPVARNDGRSPGRGQSLSVSLSLSLSIALRYVSNDDELSLAQFAFETRLLIDTRALK